MECKRKDKMCLSKVRGIWLSVWPPVNINKGSGLHKGANSACERLAIDDVIGALSIDMDMRPIDGY
jgi:hypothetical protein